jgi:DNA-binding protein H-NS
MAQVNLSRMDIQSLMDLRKRVDELLLARRSQIQKQLERMDDAIALRTGARGKARMSALKGRKVPPKYRGPSGETWAGRGARPRWLVSAMKDGNKLDDFLIGKSATKGRKKRRSKR